MQQVPDLLDRCPKDINTRAYENLKECWIERNIWDERWDLLPGMSWMNEEPLNEFIAYYAPRPILPSTNSDHEADPGPNTQINQSEEPLLGPYMSDHQVSAALEISSTSLSTPTAHVNTKTFPPISHEAQLLPSAAAAHTNREAQPLLHAATQTDPPPSLESPQPERPTVAKRPRGRHRREGGAQAAVEAPSSTAAEAPDGTASAGTLNALAATSTPRRSARVAKQDIADNNIAVEGASGMGSRPKKKATEDASGTGKLSRRRKLSKASRLQQGP
jgi:hypothetical protein